MTKTAKPIIRIKNLTTRLGGKTIHSHLNLEIKQGEILGIVGGSGSGKTTLLREMLGLLKASSGNITIFDTDITQASSKELLAIQRRWGVLFQQNALFSSLNLLENVSFPLKEHTNLSAEMVESLALMKIGLAGLPEEAAFKYPSELSGGMQKRAGIARAIALDPELLFLDEPTAGLDPKTASGFSDLILTLQEAMGLTIVMVTHDLDTLWEVTNRVAFLGKGHVIAVDSMEKLMHHQDPLIQAFFAGPRGRGAELAYQDQGK